MKTKVFFAIEGRVPDLFFNDFVCMSDISGSGYLTPIFRLEVDFDDGFNIESIQHILKELNGYIVPAHQVQAYMMDKEGELSITKIHGAKTDGGVAYRDADTGKVLQSKKKPSGKNKKLRKS